MKFIQALVYFAMLGITAACILMPFTGNWILISIALLWIPFIYTTGFKIMEWAGKFMED